jgi:hypothetical protein
MGLRSSLGAGIRVSLEGVNHTLYLWLILLDRKTYEKY